MKISKVAALLLILLELCQSCESGKKGRGAYTSPPVPTAKTEPTPPQPQQTPIDELFDDFIYLFTSDLDLQQQRILFPLPYNRPEASSRIEKNEWQSDSLYAGENFYTFIFDKEDDMELPKDTSLASVQVEWLASESRTMKKYSFTRIQKTWYLEAIQVLPLNEDESENFADFFPRFSADSLFQQERIKNPFTFVTNDPDDDFSIIRTTLDVDQWAAFRPELPPGRTPNIDYGQQNTAYSNKKVVMLKGLGSGISNTFYFQRKEGKWELYKFEDISN
jgi:hypothetical protein